MKDVLLAMALVIAIFALACLGVFLAWRAAGRLPPKGRVNYNQGHCGGCGAGFQEFHSLDCARF